MTKKVRRSNVKNGIIAPLGNGFSLAIGKYPEKEDNIHIGPNNKNGVSVDDGEILQNTGDTLRVFSAQPMFNGVSPTQLLYGGMNPNAVFNLQEQYKRQHRLNDDGSHYLNGGNKGNPPVKKGYTNSAQRDSAQVNIFKPGPNNRIQSNRIAHRKSLEAFVKKHPIVDGINTADFVDFLLDNATMESENSPIKSHGSMYGYYQLKGLNPKSTEEQQHMAAYKHLNNLFKNVITDADIAEAEKQGISQAQLLHKFWNQERKVLNYLHQGKDSADGLGTKISEWGNNNDLEIDYSPYVMKAWTDDSYIIKKGDNYEKIMKSYRGSGNKTRTFNDYSSDANLIFGVDPNKPLQIGQTLKVNTNKKAFGGIYIKPSKRGTFTAAAKKHGMGVQEFASKVLANKDNYSSAMVKKANFAKNASKWKHLFGGEDSLISQSGNDVDLNGLINRINTTSNADFVKRLKDPNRKYIKKENNIYTHLLSYVTTDDGAIVYPEVQSTDKGLKIFKGRKALDRAIEKRDTLHMSIPEAEAFTTQYKDYYPGFKFGGQTKINSLGERPNANNKQNMNNYLMGGPRKKISSTTPLEDMRKRFTKEQQNRTRFGREGSGGFGGSGASGHWDDSLELIDSVQYVRNTPILGEQTFSQAYNTARKAGLNKFVFNGKEYTTEYNPNAIIGKKQTEIAPILNLREVLDENEKPITDSTRFEPYVGQIPGKHKRVVNKKVYGGNMNNRKKALSGTQLGLLSAGMNTLGAGIGSLIQQNAINRLRYTPRVSKIYDPVKLKTDINIAPQLAEINSTISRIFDAADKTSASSRNRFQKNMIANTYGNAAKAKLLGEKENKETELINADRMNQQGMRNKTIDSVIDTLNTNIAGKDQLNNLKRTATSNNWTTALNTIAGAWGGPNGFFDREAARNIKAGELLTQSIANPTAAKLLFGDIDLTTEENRNAAFKIIYDWLNNNRLG